MGILDGIQLLLLLLCRGSHRRAILLFQHSMGFMNKNSVSGLCYWVGSFPQVFVCFLHTQQHSGFPGMRMTIPKGANARDNNVQEWAWCSWWNTHQEISHNALVLYILVHFLFLLMPSYLLFSGHLNKRHVMGLYHLNKIGILPSMKLHGHLQLIPKCKLCVFLSLKKPVWINA